MHSIEAIAILATVPDQYSALIVQVPLVASYLTWTKHQRQAIAILAAVPDQYSALIAHPYER
jgi:hypothetical protein